MNAQVLPIDARLSLLLDRLERVKRSGRGWTARCPSHPDRSASLSIGEGNNGGILVHCFAGCAPADVLASVGLTLGDLFPERLKPQTPQERRAQQQAMRETRWAAALDVLCFEAAVIQAAAGIVRKGDTLTDSDSERLNQAVERVDNARQELRRRG